MKWIGFILLGLLGLLLLLLICPIFVRIDASNGAMAVYLRILGLSFKVFPFKEKTPEEQAKEEARKAAKAEQKARAKAEKAAKDQAAADKALAEGKPVPKKKTFVQTLTFEKVCDLLALAKEAIGKVLRGFSIPTFRLYANLNGGDAANTAILYGGACSFMGAVMPHLERVCRIRKTDVQLYPAFEGETVFDLTVTIRTVPIRLVTVALILLIHFLKINKKHKAVQK